MKVTINGAFDYVSETRLKAARKDAFASGVREGCTVRGARLEVSLEAELELEALAWFVGDLALFASAGRVEANLDDGRTLVGWPGATEWALTGGEPALERSPGALHDRPIAAIASSPDGALVATAEEGLTFGRVRVFDAETRTLHHVFASGENEGGYGDNTPSPERLAWLSETRLAAWLRPRVCIFDAESGALLASRSFEGAVSLLRAVKGDLWVAHHAGQVDVLDGETLATKRTHESESIRPNGMAIDVEGTPVWSSAKGVTWWEFGDKPRVLSKSAGSLEGGTNGRLAITEHSKRGGLRLAVFEPGRRSASYAVTSTQGAPRLSTDGGRVWLVDGDRVEARAVGGDVERVIHLSGVPRRAVLDREGLAIAFGPHLAWLDEDAVTLPTLEHHGYAPRVAGGTLLLPVSGVSFGVPGALHQVDASVACLFPTGDRVATVVRARSQHRIAVRSADHGDVLVERRIKSGIHAVAAAGDTLFALTDDEVWALDSQTLETRRRWAVEGGGALIGAAAAPVACLLADGYAQVFDVTSADGSVGLEVSSSWSALSADGRQLVCSSTEATRLLDIEGGEARWTTRDFGPVAVSPVDGTVAIGERGGVVIRRPDGSLRTRLLGHRRDVLALGFDRDGHLTTLGDDLRLLHWPLGLETPPTTAVAMTR